jgi:molybdate transport system ATP-binding protein
MSIDARFKLSLGDFALDVDLSLPSSGFSALFGASGTGKSTTLRCIAGLERARGGYLKVGDDIWQDDANNCFVPTHRRPLGYVFQEVSLFPHLSVEKNLSYGFRRTPEADRKIQPDEAIEWLGIKQLLGRPTAALSGGERQRVAIARAILTSPRLLLMDEPLAALDQQSKQEILPYLESLHTQLSIPVIYVSHSTDEVARLADHMVLLEGGQVVASGLLTDVLTRLDLPLAHLDDASAVLDVTVKSIDDAYGLTVIDVAGHEFVLPRLGFEPGRSLRITIQARDVSITRTQPTDTSILNVIPATVAELTKHGESRMLVRLNAKGFPLLSRITRKSAALLNLQIGDDVFAQVKSVASLE